MVSEGHRFLVLGACGNTGQWVVRELAARFPSSSVRASVRPNGMSGPPSHWDGLANIEPMSIDLDEPDSINKAMEGVDRLVFIPQNTPRQLEHDRNVMRAAAACDTLELYVRQSVCSALSSRDSRCAFSQMHGQAEAELSESGLRYAIVRPNFAMMNVFFLVVPSLAYGAVNWPWPVELEVAHVDPRDVGAVTAAMVSTQDIERMNGAGVHVTGPEKWKPEDIVSAVAAKCGSEAYYVRIDFDEFKASLIQGANMAEWMADAVTEVFREVQRACEDGTMHVDDTGADGVLPFVANVGRDKHTFGEFLEHFSVRDAYHRMRQHSPQNPNY